ncbi:MAG: hypothetical protein FWG02_04350 [Holophagaceae bacterium]|nr:hypothetical protein [Holophagaceae bacterium]
MFLIDSISSYTVVAVIPSCTQTGATWYQDVRGGHAPTTINLADLEAR